MMKGKKRQANFEVLRVLAMVMVIILHYQIKGGIAVSLVENRSFINLLSWMIQTCCIVAVNVYVLISGYFFVETKWSMKKLLHLAAQVWFYSVMVAFLCLVLGVGDVKSWSLYDWGTVVFPLQMEHYWFATAYLIMYLFSPVIKIAIKQLSKKELQAVIILLLVVFSVTKSLIPIQIPTDKYGYDYGWFLCLYLIAGYLRMYGIDWINRIRKGLIIYLFFVIIIFGYSVFLGFLTHKGFPLAYAMDMNHSYNHIFVLLASVGIFYGFKYLKLEKNTMVKVCCKISPYTFGVYLLHEHLAIRSLWPLWFGVDSVRGRITFLPHMLLTVVVVFVIGIMIDYVRSCLFQTIEEVVNKIVCRVKRKKEQNFFLEERK